LVERKKYSICLKTKYNI